MLNDWQRASFGVFGCFGVSVGLLCLAVWLIWQIMESMGPCVWEVCHDGVGGKPLGPWRLTP